MQPHPIDVQSFETSYLLSNDWLDCTYRGVHGFKMVWDSLPNEKIWHHFVIPKPATTILSENKIFLRGAIMKFVSFSPTIGTNVFPEKRASIEVTFETKLVHGSLSGYLHKHAWFEIFWVQVTK